MDNDTKEGGVDFLSELESLKAEKLKLEHELTMSKEDLRRDEEIFVDKMQEFDDIIEQNAQLKQKIANM